MTKESLEEGLRSIVDGRPPGIAVAIVRADGSESSAASGLRDLATGAAAAPEMVAPWFSMTKIVTATVAMRLVERDVLELDAPIWAHVAQFGRLRPESDARGITARHLLTHTAGLANPIPVKWIHALDAPEVARITETRVTLTIDGAEAKQLPPPRYGESWWRRMFSR